MWLIRKAGWKPRNPTRLQTVSSLRVPDGKILDQFGSVFLIAMENILFVSSSTTAPLPTLMFIRDGYYFNTANV